MKLKRLLWIVLALALLVLVFHAASVLAQEAKPAGFVHLGEYHVEFDEAIMDDFDSDGYSELTLYYKNGVLVASAEDTNLDGQPDFWIRYTPDWYADLEVHDRDFDGEPDEFVSMDENGQVVKVEKKGVETAADLSETPEEEGGSSLGIIIIVLIIIIVAAFLVYQKTQNKKQS